MNLVIRNCVSDDIEKVHKLSNETIKTKFRINKFEKIFKKFPELCLVVLIKQEIIGFLIATIIRSKKNKCVVYSMGIKNNYRNLGFGTKILDKLCVILKEKKIKILELHVRINNTEAIEFYKNFGLEKIKVIKQFYSDGEDAVEMCMIL